MIRPLRILALMAITFGLAIQNVTSTNDLLDREVYLTNNRLNSKAICKLLEIEVVIRAISK